MKGIKNFHYQKSWNRLIACTFYPVIMELIFHRLVFPKSEETVDCMIYFAALVGAGIYILTGLFSRLTNRILFYVCTGGILVYYGVQLVYYRVFHVFFSFASAFAVGGDVLQFKNQIVHAVSANFLQLLLLCLPMALFIIFSLRFFEFERQKGEVTLARSACLLLFYFGFRFLLPVYGTEEFSPYDLYEKEWVADFGTERLGLLVMAKKDIASLVLSGKTAEGGEDIVIIERPASTPTPLPTKTPTPTPLVPETGENPDITPEPTVSPSPTPTPVDTSPNILNYDFNMLAAEEKNAEIKNLHTYFANEEFTRKNEYTGMFEGYNLIYITAEGFSPYAIADGLTPTLKKMATEGFVFSNYYAPIWGTSTIDGEFINCTGLLPDATYSLRRMIGHDMRFCFGNMFGKLGYQTNAYHNHTDNYYQRDRTHPSMGYNYKGRTAMGMEMENGKYPWPCSDLYMMELTVPEYVNSEPFHTYYMTVSGHMEYTFIDNTMAYRNRSYVKDLPYSDNAKAYIACNYELEKALTYLVEQLEEAGVADRTVIALATDHYPYGLEKKVIDELAGHVVEENFELYKSTLIIWSPSMKEPVPVDKYCSALDIAPTLANLFGLDYDSRLYMGKDILSDSEGLVIFNNKSFITDKLMYNSKNGAVTSLTDEEIPENYVSTIRQIVKNRFAVSKKIIDLDYYRYLPEFSPVGEE